MTMIINPSVHKYDIINNNANNFTAFLWPNKIAIVFRPLNLSFSKSLILFASIIVPIKIAIGTDIKIRSEEHTSELQSRLDLVCRLLLEKKNKKFCKSTPLRKEYRNRTTKIA